MLKTLESTGQELGDMTTQQVFDFVGEYLLSQEKRSVVKNCFTDIDECTYDLGGVNRCAVGICLTEEQLLFTIQNDLHSVSVCHLIEHQDECDFTGLCVHEDVLADLQNIHDCNFDRKISKEYLTVELTRAAELHKLTTDNLSHLFAKTCYRYTHK